MYTWSPSIHSSLGALASASIELCILGLFNFTHQVYIALFRHLQVPEQSYVYLSLNLIICH